MGCILNSPNSNALSCKKFHRIGLSICKPGKGSGYRHRFLFVPYRESLHSPAAFWVCPGKSFFLSFLFPGGCSMGCPPDTPPGRRFHIFGGRSQTPLGSGSPIPMPTSPFIGSFFGQCRRNSCRRHRSHFGKAAGYPAVISVNKVLFAEKPYNMDCNSSRKPIYWQYHIRGGHNSQTSVYRHRDITGNEMCIGR